MQVYFSRSEVFGFIKFDVRSYRRAYFPCRTVSGWTDVRFLAEADFFVGLDFAGFGADLDAERLPRRTETYDLALFCLHPFDLFRDGSCTSGVCDRHVHIK